MAVRVSVTSAANADLIRAFAWYERQSPGLGMDFVSEVDAAVVRITRHPRLLAPACRGLRRVFTRRFPYCIYYDCPSPGHVCIVAVLHGAMDRTSLHTRLPSKPFYPQRTQREANLRGQTSII